MRYPCNVPKMLMEKLVDLSSNGTKATIVVSSIQPHQRKSLFLRN